MTFLIVAVTHYHSQAQAHAYFWFTHILCFMDLGLWEQVCVCAWFRRGKDKVSDFGEGGDCSVKVENGMQR